jgi:hypothetical protein
MARQTNSDVRREILYCVLAPSVSQLRSARKSVIWQMADIHDCAVIATAGIAIDQKVTATLGPHMAQSHGCQLPNFGRRHASQFAPPSAFWQQPRRARPLYHLLVLTIRL